LHDARQITAANAIVGRAQNFMSIARYFKAFKTDAISLLSTNGYVGLRQGVRNSFVS
jgi:hypothetical protein